MTADGPLGYYLEQRVQEQMVFVRHRDGIGCGIAPSSTRHEPGAFPAMGDRPRVVSARQGSVACVMSTDHPNGGSFLAYPQIIQLLIDRTLSRRHDQAGAPGGVGALELGELTREYSLYEICIITRSGPAKILGLANKGHLGPAPTPTSRSTAGRRQDEDFRLPRAVIKSGVVIVDQGEIREPLIGKLLLYVAPEYDVAIETDIADGLRSTTQSDSATTRCLSTTCTTTRKSPAQGSRTRRLRRIYACTPLQRKYVGPC